MDNRRPTPSRSWTLAQRLALQASKNPSGCWIFAGAPVSGGYRRLSFRGASLYAHRAAWEVANGPIPAGLFVCHTCDVPACVNPDHLWLGTHDDNVADKVAKGRQTHNHGTASGTAKLTGELAREIRVASGTQKEIAAKYGVAQSTICRVRRRAAWIE